MTRRRSERRDVVMLRALVVVLARVLHVLELDQDRGRGFGVGAEHGAAWSRAARHSLQLCFRLPCSQKAPAPALPAEVSLPPVLADARAPALLALASPHPVLAEAPAPALLALASPPPVLADAPAPALLALVSPPPVLAEAPAPALLAVRSHPPVLADAEPPSSLHTPGLPPMLADARAPALLAHASLPPVLAEARAPALLALVSLPPVLADLRAPALLALASLPCTGFAASRARRSPFPGPPCSDILPNPCRATFAASAPPAPRAVASRGPGRRRRAVDCGARRERRKDNNFLLSATAPLTLARAARLRGPRRGSSLPFAVVRLAMLARVAMSSLRPNSSPAPAAPTAFASSPARVPLRVAPAPLHPLVSSSPRSHRRPRLLLLRSSGARPTRSTAVRSRWRTS